MKTTVSDRLTNRQLFELCKKEFTLDNMSNPIYEIVYQLIHEKALKNPDQPFICPDDLDRWAVQYTLNYNAPQS